MQGMKEPSVETTGKNSLEERNIPATGFKSSGEEIRENRVTIKQRVSATLALSLFSVVQFIEGFAQIAREEFKNTDNPQFSPTKLRELVMLYGMLQSAFQEHMSRDEKDRGDVILIPVIRENVRNLKLLLEARMLHCEQEREKRSKNFNPDTYIGQKLLLIDLREWLLGEIID